MKTNSIESVFGYKMNLLTISFVSKFYLGCRLLRHRSRDHEITQRETSVVDAWNLSTWREVNGCRVGEILWTWSWGWAMWKAWKRPSFVFCRMYNFSKDSKCKKVKPSPLDALFFVIYSVASVVAETPTSGNNVDTSGENNSTIKDTKMLVCILLCKLDNKLLK